jgi:hypothetical protein
MTVIPLDSRHARILHEQRLREAEQRRLANRASANQPGPMARLLAGLNHQLVAWSQRRRASAVQLKSIPADE